MCYALRDHFRIQAALPCCTKKNGNLLAKPLVLGAPMSLLKTFGIPEPAKTWSFQKYMVKLPDLLKLHSLSFWMRHKSYLRMLVLKFGCPACSRTEVMLQQRPGDLGDQRDHTCKGKSPFALCDHVKFIFDHWHLACTCFSQFWWCVFKLECLSLNV